MKVTTETTQALIAEVYAERERQDAKFGEQNHKELEFYAILFEEAGEAAKEVVNAHFGYVPMRKALMAARKEYIQTAAVAYQMIEASFRKDSFGRDRSDLVTKLQWFIGENIQEAVDIPNSKGTLSLLDYVAGMTVGLNEIVENAMTCEYRDLMPVERSEYEAYAISVSTLSLAAVFHIDQLLTETPE